MYFWTFVTFIYFQASISAADRGGDGGPEYFLCGNNEFIGHAHFCDGEHHCKDRSDEDTTSVVGNDFEPLAQFQWCNNQKNDYNESCLVPRAKICNVDVICLGLTPCDIECDTHYWCQDTNSCATRKSVCNGNPCDGCKEDHDWQNGLGFKCYRNGRLCILPQQMARDSIPDCDGGVDLCFADAENGTNGILDRKKCFQCLDDVTLVAASSVCDGVVNCPDLSDECLCDDHVPDICQRVIARGQKNTPATTPAVPTNTSRPPEWGPRVVQKSKPNFTDCEAGRVMCEDGRCINRKNVCDGIRHCEKDESYDICRGTIRCVDATGYEELCRCDPWSTCHMNYGTACDGKLDCPIPSRPGENIRSKHVHPEDECDATCPKNASHTAFPCEPFHISAVGTGVSFFPCTMRDGNLTLEMYLDGEKVCDGVADCPDESDEINCRHRFTCAAKRAGYVSIELEKTCDGTEHCHDGTDESVELCGEKRFHCPYLGGAKVSIIRDQVCDLHITCDDATDEMNCTDDRFYCENGDPLFVRARQIFDGRKDCSDWSDECPMKDQSTATDVFSSRYELIANPVLRVFVWIMGLLSIIGNSIVIYRESKYMKKARRASAVTMANRLLVLNLACSDVIMGIYLISLAGMSLKMQGNYCSHDLIWRSSDACITLGVLSVISSETSVLTMVLLASCRLYGVIHPFRASKHPRKQVVVLLLVLAWLTSFLFALLPLAPALEGTFVTEAELGDNPFSRNIKMKLADAKTLYRRLVTYDLKQGVQHPEDVDDFLSRASWTDLDKSAKAYFNHDNFEIVRYFGYYSANSVCVPKFFASRSDPAWGFSFFINLFNFLAFTFVASAYGAIQCIAKRKAAVRGKAGENDKAAKSLQRKILRLIITDFCCWIPICVMSFCRLAGAEVGNLAYAFSAIILLPINSALNPLLYSNLPDHLYKKLRSGTSTIRSHTTSSGSQPRNRVTAQTNVPLPSLGNDSERSDKPMDTQL